MLLGRTASELIRTIKFYIKKKEQRLNPFKILWRCIVLGDIQSFPIRLKVISERLWESTQQIPAEGGQIPTDGALGIPQCYHRSHTSRLHHKTAFLGNRGSNPVGSFGSDTRDLSLALHKDPKLSVLAELKAHMISTVTFALGRPRNTPLTEHAGCRVSDHLQMG